MGRPSQRPRTFLRAEAPLRIPAPSTEGIQGFPRTTREACEGSWLRARGQQEPEEDLVHLGARWERGGLWAGRMACVRETRQAREPLTTLYLADSAGGNIDTYSSPGHTYLCLPAMPGHHRPPRFQAPGGFSWHMGPPAPPAPAPDLSLQRQWQQREEREGEETHIPHSTQGSRCS